MPFTAWIKDEILLWRCRADTIRNYVITIQKKKTQTMLNLLLNRCHIKHYLL